MTASTIDAVELAQSLIRCPSVTPEDAGALDVLQSALEGLGFACHRLTFDEGGPSVQNLYARCGASLPNFCFAGHTDVVPVGDRDAWSDDPFAGSVSEGTLLGRGAVDMKGAIAAFVAACARFLGAGPVDGSISLLITGDEEGPAVDGTTKVLDWLAARGERLDACLVGEPTNRERLGDLIKIGRRGSLSARLVVSGVQGHTAYPHLADNPVHRLVAMLSALTTTPLDDGSDHFEASTVQVTTVDVGNPATNVIPAQAGAAINVRFNDRHSSGDVADWLHERLRSVGGAYALDIHVSGESFLTPPGELSAVISGAVERVTGALPELGTSGGTSDARFIKDYCPVAEFGLIGQTMHKVDECVPVGDIHTLSRIYEAVLVDYLRPVG